MKQELAFGKTSLHDVREEYCSAGLLEANSSPNAIKQFELWYKQAEEAKLPKVNAMHLSTCSNNIPDNRVVLLKEFDQTGFTFFTDYDSNKGRQLLENPNASLTFFWAELDRQVRIQGTVIRVSEASSKAYFDSRPKESKRSAIASHQSTIVDSRDTLEKAVKAVQSLEKPARWGGFLLKPITIEFWQGRPDRLHDRLRYQMQDGNIQRLSP